MKGPDAEPRSTTQEEPNGSNFRVLAKDMFTYGLGDLFAKASGFVSVPIYTRFFSTSEYGALGAILAVSAFLSSLLVCGCDSIYARLYFEASTEEDKRRVTSSLLFGFTLLSLLGIMPFLVLADPLAEVTTGNRLHRTALLAALAGIPPMIACLLLGQALRNTFRTVVYSAVNGTHAWLSLAIGLFAVFQLKLGLLGIFLGPMISFLISLPFRIWVVRESLAFRVSWPTFFEALRLGLPLAGASLSYWIFTLSDRILLTRLASLNDTGLFSAAVSLLAPLALVMSVLSSAWSPRFFQTYERNPVEAGLFARDMLTLTLLFFGTIAIAVATFAPDLLVLFAGVKYGAASVVVPTLLLGMVASATTQVTALGFAIAKQTTPIFQISLGAAALNVCLNLVLIPRFGILGAGLGTMAANLFLTTTYFFLSRKYFRIPLRAHQIGTLAICILASLLAASWINLQAFAGSWILKLLNLFGFLAAIHLFRLSPEGLIEGLLPRIKSRTKT